jgi:hypothetical protein
MSAQRRFKTADDPCPICGGWERMPRDRGTRCSGYIDGDFICCTREEHAGRLAQNAGGAYAHKRFGPCLCGKQHGAEVRDIAQSQRAKIIERYAYRGLDGQVVYEAVRLEPKGFRQRRLGPGGEWIWNLQGVAPLLYRLPEVVAAVAAGDPVWIAEGERDVHALEQAGLVATTNSGGAGKFPAAMAKHLAGADVTIVQDKDDPGRAHARDVAAKLRGVAKSVRIVEAKSGKDARDHLESSLTPGDFVHVWPTQCPIERKRDALRTAAEIGAPFEEQDPAKVFAEEDSPRWPTGIKGPFPIGHFAGLTIISGGPSAAKSYLALGSSLSAAMYYDWDVFYLHAEMSPKLIIGRVVCYLGCLPPQNWKLISVKPGAGVAQLIEYIAERVTARKTLLVFDSLSSFIDQGLAVSAGDDAFGMKDLKRIFMWMMNVRNETKGEVSFLVLSELAGKEGHTRGKFVDHKADLVVRMEKNTDDESDTLTKFMEITKGWDASVGTRLRMTLDWRTASLSLARDERPGYDGDE